MRTLFTSPAAVVLWLGLSVLAALLYPAHAAQQGGLQLESDKATLHYLLLELIPFAGERHFRAPIIWLIIGMVKCTALCSIGSVLYTQWKKPKQRLGSTSEKHAEGSDEEDGKCIIPYSLHSQFSNIHLHCLDAC